MASTAVPTAAEGLFPSHRAADRYWFCNKYCRVPPSAARLLLDDTCDIRFRLFDTLQRPKKSLRVGIDFFFFFGIYLDTPRLSMRNHRDILRFGVE